MSVADLTTNTINMIRPQHFSISKGTICLSLDANVHHATATSRAFARSARRQPPTYGNSPPMWSFLRAKATDPAIRENSMIHFPPRIAISTSDVVIWTSSSTLAFPDIAFGTRYPGIMRSG